MAPHHQCSAPDQSVYTAGQAGDRSQGLYKVTPGKAKPGESGYGLAPDDINQPAAYDQSYDDYPPAQQQVYSAMPASQPSSRYNNWGPGPQAGY
jgi:hypothetical protein